MRYQTRRMLRTDNSYLRAELARVQQELGYRDGHLAEVTLEAGLLKADRQSLVDRYWQQQSTAYFRFGLQMGLGLLMLLVCAGAGTYMTWHTHQALWLRLLATAVCAMLASGFVPISRYIGRLDDAPESVTLPSGAIVPVSPAVVAETQLIMAQMAS